MLATATLFVVLITVPDSDPPVVRGIDLNGVPVTSEGKVPEFFEPSPGNPKKKVWRKSVFKMPLLPRQKDSAWLYYPAGTGRFYIQYRSDRKDPKTEKLYGPIEGKPFAMMKLEAEMIEKLKKGEGYDVNYRLKLMLKTQDESLSRRAFRVLYRMTELDVEGYALEQNLKQVKQIFEPNLATLTKHVKPDQLAKLQAKITKAEARVESLVLEISDDEYLKAAEVMPPVPGKIDAVAWGEAVNGLRMSAVPVESAAVEMEQVIYLHLVLENTSKKPIRLSVSDVPQDAQTSVRLPDGKQLRVNGTMYSGMSPIVRFHLEPGDRAVIGKVGLTAVEDRAKVKSQYAVSPVIHKAVGDKLQLKVNYTLLVGYGSAWSRGADGTMRRTSPAKGEYIGKLITGDAAVSFTKPVKEN